MNTFDFLVGTEQNSIGEEQFFFERKPQSLFDPSLITN